MTTEPTTDPTTNPAPVLDVVEPALDVPDVVEPTTPDTDEVTDNDGAEPVLDRPYAVNANGDRIDGPIPSIDQGVRPFPPAPTVFDRIAAAEQAGDWTASRRMKSALTFDPSWRRLNTP